MSVSDHSLYFIELIKNKNRIEVGRYGERNLPEGVMGFGEIARPRALVDILSLLKEKEGLAPVRVSLPEEPEDMTEDNLFVSSSNSCSQIFAM